MKAADCKTVRQLLAWSYANLARAHAAIEDQATRYTQGHHIVRNKMYHGLVQSTMHMRTLFDDERSKLKSARVCSYCGSDRDLAIDHLMPSIRGGPNLADNLILACRTCNSSKSSQDLMAWMAKRQAFPPLLVLRRYLKLAWRICEDQGLLDCALDDHRLQNLPFDVNCVPTSFPPLGELRLSASIEED